MVYLLNPAEGYMRSIVPLGNSPEFTAADGRTLDRAAVLPNQLEDMPIGQYQRFFLADRPIIGVQVLRHAHSVPFLSRGA
ncbi:hypothetical protein SAMN04489807_2113 [Microbacterium hydrocarbonoxydans]|uniref:Uncharacterized protein n=1 Tax=Microbacterium hydrocarbonoxydans TaxID=273678 RepID=A0A1H4MFU4_9MICO|nr:hypothetical protein SAMN04489807_2113 [Microbacterium hydrocarbonoxydans]